MFIKLGVILFILQITRAEKEDSEWDLAVAISDQVELLYSNGSLLGSAVQQFSNLKALTFDNIRHQLVVSDMDQKNDTIYGVQLTKQTDIIPIVQDLPDDVQGLAIDPITDVLYWTDTANRSINYVSLQDPIHESKILIQFDDQNPQDIAIDVCKRYIYWTNSEIDHATIERATLDGRNREILIDQDLHMPTGITLDHITQRIFWTDKRQGIYYRIESSKFDGSQRQLVFEGTHQKPFGIAVDKEAIYWTDINNNALWKKKKKEDHQPEKLRHFNENPMGLVAKHLNIQNISECSRFFEAMESYNGSSTERFESANDEVEEIQCLNGGEIGNDGCKCKRGFTGRRCQIELCHNFCMHGNCHLSSVGYPQCHCPVGFQGTRCDNDMCNDFCLNDGKCLRTRNSTFGVRCRCPEGYFGERCEKSYNPEELCGLFCSERESDVLMDRSNTFICQCEQGSYRLLETTNELAAFELISGEAASHPSLLNHFQDTAFVILAVCMLVMLILIIVLSVFICKLKRRPRIKKRIIVNKNITPLTYRPQPNTQQCEITIENCCNMNVCETPCFEPPQLRPFQASKKDEKKTLLSNMENGEDFY